MGQAKIRRDRQRAEVERRKAGPPANTYAAPSGTNGITINTDGISDEQKATQKFKSAYNEMLAQLTAPGFAPVLCAHEFAHLIYFGQLGEIKYEPQAARLRYDPAIDDYVGSLAAIQFLDMPMWTEGKFHEWLYKVAKGHAAGGVVARKLMPTSDGGDADDKDRFKKLCDKFNEDPKVKVDFDYWWKLAQETIAQELENPEFMELIKQEAAKLRPLLGL